MDINKSDDHRIIRFMDTYFKNQLHWMHQIMKPSISLHLQENLSLFLSLDLTLSVFLSLCRHLSLCHSPLLCLSLSLYVSLSFFPTHSLHLFLSFALSLYLHLHLTLFLCHENLPVFSDYLKAMWRLDISEWKNIVTINTTLNEFYSK